MKKNNLTRDILKDFDRFLRKDFSVVGWIVEGRFKKIKKRKTETHRWFFCEDGRSEDNLPSDCACCLDNRDHKDCGCVCHDRIYQLKGFIKKTISKVKRSERNKIVDWTKELDKSGCGLISTQKIRDFINKNL